MKTRMRGVVVVLLLTGLAAVGALAQGPRPGGILTVADQVGPPSIDPHKDYSYHGSAMILTLLYEGLLTRDDKGALQPNLAESWKNVSPTVYEFRIRRGVLFHNGREMDANDVKYSFEREMDPKRGPPSGCCGVRSTGSRSQTSGQSASI